MFWCVRSYVQINLNQFTVGIFNNFFLSLMSMSNNLFVFYEPGLRFESHRPLRRTLEHYHFIQHSSFNFTSSLH